jgi:hypothetical protein
MTDKSTLILIKKKLPCFLEDYCYDTDNFPLNKESKKWKTSKKEFAEKFKNYCVDIDWKDHKNINILNKCLRPENIGYKKITVKGYPHFKGLILKENLKVEDTSRDIYKTIRKKKEEEKKEEERIEEEKIEQEKIQQERKELNLKLKGEFNLINVEEKKYSLSSKIAYQRREKTLNEDDLEFYVILHLLFDKFLKAACNFGGGREGVKTLMSDIKTAFIVENSEWNWNEESTKILDYMVSDLAEWSGYDIEEVYGQTYFFGVQLKKKLKPKKFNPKTKGKNSNPTIKKTSKNQQIEIINSDTSNSDTSSSITTNDDENNLYDKETGLHKDILTEVLLCSSYSNDENESPNKEIPQRLENEKSKENVILSVNKK